MSHKWQPLNLARFIYMYWNEKIPQLFFHTQEASWGKIYTLSFGIKIYVCIFIEEKLWKNIPKSMKWLFWVTYYPNFFLQSIYLPLDNQKNMWFEDLSFIDRLSEWAIYLFLCLFLESMRPCLLRFRGRGWMDACVDICVIFVVPPKHFVTSAVFPFQQKENRGSPVLSQDHEHLKDFYWASWEIWGGPPLGIPALHKPP